MDPATGETRLADNDARLLNFLARGMTQRDWAALMAETGNPDQTSGEIADIMNRYRDTPIHKSPFNHAFMRFYCTAPIFVARQMVKHEYLVWNEISGRYVQFGSEKTPAMIFTPEEWRAASADKKQGSGGSVAGGVGAIATEAVQDVALECLGEYRYLLGLGVCEEQARMVLPLNLCTEWIWSGSLWAFAKMCKLRMAPDAQKETRLLAEQIDRQARVLFPVSWEALMSNGTSGVVAYEKEAA